MLDIGRTDEESNWMNELLFFVSYNANLTESLKLQDAVPFSTVAFYVRHFTTAVLCVTVYFSTWYSTSTQYTLSKK